MTLFTHTIVRCTVCGQSYIAEVDLPLGNTHWDAAMQWWCEPSEQDWRFDSVSHTDKEPCPWETL